MSNEPQVPEYIGKIKEFLDKHKALLVGGDVCFSCMTEDKIATMGLLPGVTLKGKIGGKDAPPHESLAFFLCVKCKENPQSSLQIMQNINRMMSEFNTTLL
jgi:hypothetical protein